MRNTVGCSWKYLMREPKINAGELERFKKSGLDCVEVAAPFDDSVPYKTHLNSLKTAIGTFLDAGIAVWSVHSPGVQELDISHPEFCGAGIDYVDKFMEICAQAGIDKIVLHPSYEPILPHQRHLRLERCAQSVKALYRPDVAIALETLPRTCLLSNAEEVTQMRALTKGYAGFCVDLNHSHQDSIIDVLHAAGDDLITIHVSDDDGIDEKHWFPTKGVLDWPGIVNTLNRINYSGCYMYEVRVLDFEAIRANFDMITKGI